MGFLRRILGGGDRDRSDETASSTAPPPVDTATVDDDERARELELARFDQDRIDDLVRRQQRYADRSWTPPAQGGDRRSGDEDATAG